MRRSPKVVGIGSTRVEHGLRTVRNLVPREEGRALHALFLRARGVVKTTGTNRDNKTRRDREDNKTSRQRGGIVRRCVVADGRLRPGCCLCEVCKWRSCSCCWCCLKIKGTLALTGQRAGTKATGRRAQLGNGPAPTLAANIRGTHWRRAFPRPVALRGHRAGTGPAPTLAASPGT